MMNINLSKNDLENEIALNLENCTEVSLLKCLEYSLKRCLAEQVKNNSLIINNLLIDSEVCIESETNLYEGLSLKFFEKNKIRIRMNFTIKIKGKQNSSFDDDVSINFFGSDIGFLNHKKVLKKQINYIYKDLNFQLPLMDIRGKLSGKILAKLEMSYIPQGVYLCEYDLFNCAHEEMTYINQSNGKRYLCSCTKKFHNELLLKSGVANMRDVYHKDRFMLSELNSLPRLDDICHLCIIKKFGAEECILRYGEPSSTLHYCFEAYANYKRYDAEWSWICDNLEIVLGRQKWLNENKVFLFTKDLLVGQRIVREASPSWLGKQRLDVYLPDLNLAIEYQGKQHTESIEFFGGQASLDMNIERDARKARLCKENGIDMIFVYYYEDVTLNLMKKKLRSYLKK